MLFLIFIPIIFFLTFRNFFEDGIDDFLDFCGLTFLSLILSCLISIAPLGIAAIIGQIPDICGVTDQDYPLVSLKDKDGISGQFYFLGAGQIQDEQYYYWYRKNPDSSISGGKTPRLTGVKIFYSDSLPPTIRFYKTVYVKYHSWYWWWIGIDMRFPEWGQQFIIPKGSIKEGFSL